ncbi:MAG: ABC transporter ATP-binding protein [Opitutaceae bacterium]|nr:ABC transporter ATP-binding protein [Opitutaceae bacterium]
MSVSVSSSDSLAIEVRELTKRYQPDGSLASWLLTGLGLNKNLAPSADQPSVALLDVSFAVARGASFGVIGRNGAGKSTLLQILAGTLRPSSGDATVRGRVTALLELGSGFNPEFSGRENIFLAGAILGLSRAEMEAKYDEVVRFADIGSYIELPVKTYSTGMMMRVAFAVAIAVEPDVLIIDEALGVGDILFQQKCSRRLQELVAAGVTLLVVTHDLSFVLNMCQRALWLDQGRVRFLGDAGACVREYVAAMAAISGNTLTPTDDLKAAAETDLPAVQALELSDKERLGDGGVRVARAWLQHADGGSGGSFRSGDWAVVSLLIEATRPARAISAGCEVRNRHGQVVFATGLRVTKKLIHDLSAGESCLVTIRFQLELQAGQYTLDLGCGAGTDVDNTWDRVLNAAVIEVSNPPDQEIIHGLARLPYEIRVARPRAVK